MWLLLCFKKCIQKALTLWHLSRELKKKKKIWRQSWDCSEEEYCRQKEKQRAEDPCFMCLSYRKEADASQTLLVRRAMEGLKGRRLFQGLLGYFKDQGFYQWNRKLLQDFEQWGQVICFVSKESPWFWIENRLWEARAEK